WRTAEVVTALAITPREGEPVKVRLHSHVEHGPWRDGWVQARITSELVLPPEIAAQIDPVFGGRSPLVAVTSIGLLGEVDGTLGSPAVQVADGAIRVDWKGLQSRFHVDRDAQTMRYSGAMPGLVLGPTGEPATVRFDGFALETRGRRSEASGLWLSSGSADLA